MKQLIGSDAGAYAFNASAKTITFSGITLTLAQILLVVDSTLGVIIYATGSGIAATYAGGVMTLASVPGGAANTDKLQIYADVPAVVQAVSATALPLPTGAAQDGTDASGVSAPTGAVGIRGWLSAIYNVLKNGTLAVTGTFYQVTQPVSATTLPLPTNAAQETGGNLATLAGSISGGKQKVSAAAGDVVVELSDATNIIGTTAHPVQTQDQLLNTSGGGGYVRQDSTGTIAKETGGNLATVATAQGAGATGIVQLTGGSGILGWLSGMFSYLATLVASGGGGYVRQDSTGTIAKETGGNLATLAGAVSSTKMKVSAAAGDVIVEISDATNIIGTTTHPVQTQDQSTKSTSGATAATAPTSAGLEGTIGLTALPTAVTTGQLVGAMSDKYGRSVVLPITIRDLTGTVSVQTTDTSSHTLITGVSGIFSDITTLVITNETATATVVSLSDGTTTYKIAIAANGGGVIPLPLPLPATSVATNWTVQSSAIVTLDFIAVYAKNK